METDFSYIDENLKKIFFNVNEAAAKYRKPDEKIRVMAVTKTVAPEAVNHAVGLGLDLLGENRVQEYLSKKDFYIIDSVSLIQSVDSVKLAAEINKNALRVNKLQDILIEVNIGNEESKGGIDKSQLQELLSEVSEMKNIRVKGLMAIPPIENPEKFLCDMQQLYIDISSENMDNINMDILSMGMSNDYVKAIEYGSNLVRIGRGLFGPRNYNK